MVSQCWQTDVRMETHHARAHVPVSRECTTDTERFFHFHEWKSFCFTALGTGSCWSKWWTTLKIRENASTDRPGWLLSAGNSASILTSSPPPLHSPFGHGSACFPSYFPFCNDPLTDVCGMWWECRAGSPAAGGVILRFDWWRKPDLSRYHPSQLIPVCWCLSAQQRAVAPLSARLPEEWGWEWWTGSGVGGAAAAALLNYENREEFSLWVCGRLKSLVQKYECTFYSIQIVYVWLTTLFGKHCLANNSSRKEDHFILVYKINK